MLMKYLQSQLQLFKHFKLKATTCSTRVDYSNISIAYSCLLQRGLLPGHHYWHGPHYEYVHCGAVWRHCHGEYETLSLLPLKPPPSFFSLQPDCISKNIVQIQQANTIQMWLKRTRCSLLVEKMLTDSSARASSLIT